MPSSLPNEQSSAAAFYAVRLRECQTEGRRLRRRHVLLGYLRLFLAAGVLVLAYLAFVRHTLAWEWLLLPFAGFGAAARWLTGVLRARARSSRAERFCEHGLARLENRWAGLHPRKTRADEDKSLYAVDLDLFGPRSLFELLCTARTTLGEDMLAGWLLEPAAPEEVLARQAAVAELQDRTKLREAFGSVPGPDVLETDRDALVPWGESATLCLPPMLRWLAPLLVVCTVTATVRWTLGHSPVLLDALLIVNGSITFFLRSRFRSLFGEAERASRRLVVLAELAGFVEREAFAAPRLQALQAALRGGPQPASRAIRRLSTLTGAAEQRTNYVTRILEFALLYSVQLGFVMQAWRQRHGCHLRAWLHALGEMEALLSLSAYHFEHPADCFPEISTEAPAFIADALGHPLLPEAAGVRNSVTLDQTTRLLLISGSNMSGKSTLLRSVGVAAVLAMAGAPVRARSLRLSSLRVAASIQINDSLQSGRSHFYAEIQRLRAICELARQRPPVLFLLDELLAGTNSHDRLAGAAGVVKELLGAGALGLLSTHDLALTGISGPQAALIRNAHFEDSVVADELRFDYTLRDGVVTRSNGLALMRLIGLDV